MDVNQPQPLADKVRRAQREERKGWTLEKEQDWISRHPDDEPLPEYTATLQAAAQPEQPTFDADLVPEVDEYERPPEEIELDRFIEGIGIAEAYNKWAGKGKVPPGKKTEGIKVRCPNPNHPDHDPSAWLNTNKNVWVCGGCGMEGGDKFDIAAWGLGFDVPGYKSGKYFPELRRAMAMSLGHTIRSGGSGGDRVIAPEPEPQPDSVPAEPSPEPERGDDDQPSATVTTLHPDPGPTEPPMTEQELNDIKIDWPKLMDESNFLVHWMNATSRDDLPEEFYFWCGLLAIGFTAGNDVYLEDLQDVYANLFMTVIGTTGSGKSRSINNMKRMLYTALPFEEPTNFGTKMVTGLASGEALVDQFYEPEDPLDPTNKNAVPVRGLIDFSELSFLVGKASSAASTIKPKLMDFYDHVKVIDASSRTSGDVKAIDSFASCITTTQPRSVRRLVTDSDLDSGFMNRWVFVYGISKDRIAYGGKPVDLAQPIEALKDLKRWCAKRRSTDGAMRLENDALDLWVKFHVETIQKIIDPKNYDESLEENPMYGRIELLFKKLILLFAIDAKEKTPSVRSVEKALALWPYIKVCYTRVSGNIVATEEGDLENDIIAFITKYCEDGKRKPRRANIADSMARKGHRREDIKRALERLIYLDVLEEEESRQGSRGPTRKYIVMKD